VFWVCRGCGGRIGTIGLLRKVLAREIVERYWWSARRRKPVGRRGRPCPACTQPMREIDGPAGTGLPALEICKYCQLFWFDPGEYHALPPPEPPDEGPAVHPAVAAVRAAQAARRERIEIRPVERLNWQVAFAALAVPIEVEAPVRRRFPVATLTTAVALVAVSLLAYLSDFDDTVESFGFQAAHPWRLGGLTMVTSFFLHGDPVHLLGNLYFLGLVGDNVEDFLGRWGYGLLLLASIVAGDLLHMALAPDPFRLAIGASGGISGLLAFYVCRFPRARLAGVANILPVQFSAWWGFLFWVVLQLALSLRQMGGEGAISGLAHLGGALAGVAVWAGEELYSRGRAALPALWGRRPVASAAPRPGE
jgi:membrane associated rhomboid family serine protease